MREGGYLESVLGEKKNEVFCSYSESKTAIKVFNKLGLHTTLKISEACADFYILERMVADNFKPAIRLAHLMQSELAREFSIYIDMVIGGEYRHAWGEHKRTGMEIPFALLPYMRAVCSVGYDRTKSWLRWIEFRENNPNGKVTHLHAMADSFEDELWDNRGVGGCGWATAARILADFYEGKIKNQAFVDRCFTLQHNYGVLFDKAYDVDNLGIVLRLQFQNRYDRLSRYASPHVRRLYGIWEQERFEGFDPVWLGRS